ncbi:hypothetical protein BC628DRAFT_787986 [Trametes gibbosa]|nr:hypothetical protein BC628DRAFT_787986 [Trametes gibbosa]UVI59168.1 Zn(2)-Cys(6)70 [Trametes gibbosa]
MWYVYSSAPVILWQHPQISRQDLLRDRIPFATPQELVQPTIYNPASFYPETVPDNRHAPIFGPFPQSSHVQPPFQPTFESPSEGLTNSGPSYYAYPRTSALPVVSLVETDHLHGTSTFTSTPELPFSLSYGSPLITSNGNHRETAPGAYNTSLPSCPHPSDPPIAPALPPSTTVIYPSLRALACTHCHRSRKKCGQERPCKRCVHSGLVCVGRPSAPRRSGGTVGLAGACLLPSASGSGSGGLARARTSTSGSVAGASWGDVSGVEAYGPFEPAGTQSECVYGASLG